MKFFLSAVLLATASMAFGQEYQRPTPVQGVGVAGMEPDSPQRTRAAQAQAEAAMQALFNQVDQAGCPLYLTSADVARGGAVLAVSQRTPGDGALALHFRNRSGKAITSAAITARLRVKTNVYALDAHPLEVKLTFPGTADVNKAADQLARIAVPKGAYLFGVAQVTLDRVTFADGSAWTASASRNLCVTGPADSKQIAR